jgi:hypothetical protein
MGYSKLFYIMTEFDNLDIDLRVNLSYFSNVRGGNLDIDVWC